MISTDLRIAEQVFCRMSLHWDLSDFVLIVRSGLRVFGERPPKWCAIIILYHGHVLSLWLITVDLTLITWWRSGLSVFSMGKLLFLPLPFHTVLSGGKSSGHVSECCLHFKPCIALVAWLPLVITTHVCAHTAPPTHTLSVWCCRYLFHALSPFLCTARSCVLPVSLYCTLNKYPHDADRGKFPWPGVMRLWVAEEGLFGLFSAIRCDTGSS